MEKRIITVSARINAPIEKVWKCWTSPQHIMQWNNASPDWHTTKAENDLRVGGKFNYRMEAKDGSFGFDFEGIYTEIKTNETIAYKGDNREVNILFKVNANETGIIESFEAETENPIEIQRAGWQAILDNFKKYTESH